MKKVLKCFLFIFSLFMCGMWFAGCKSMEDLLDDYNKNFTNASGDEGSHSETAMIKRLDFMVEEGSSLNVPAPDWVEDYEWKLFGEDSSETYIYMSKNEWFYYSFPLNKTGDYQLVLTATSKETGSKLTDKAMVHLYRMK